MNKNSAKKSNIKNPRIYFISKNADEDLLKIKSNLEKDENEFKFYNKAYKTTTSTKEIFINIKLNIDFNDETFKKVSKKFNNILGKEYKIFYSDVNNKFIYVPENLLNEINNSVNMFINDD